MRLRRQAGKFGRTGGVHARPMGILLASWMSLGLALISTACAANPPTAEPTAIASTEPLQPEASQTAGPDFPYPAAMLLFNPSNGGLDLVSQDGVGLADMGTITWTDPNRRRGAILGSLGGEFGRVRFAYLTENTDGLELNVRSAIGTVTLDEFPAGALMAGSVPAGLLAVSAPEVAGVPDNTGSTIYVIDPVRRTGMNKPILDGLEPGVVPLRLQIENDQPTGVLYCLGRAEGEADENGACYGLYRVELASGEVEQIIPGDLAIVALSTDMRIAALASSDRIPPEVRVRNLETGAEIVFRSEPGVREVGDGALSPAGARLAWVSMSHGDADEDIPAISLASAAGGPVTQLADASLSEAVGAQVTHVRPVGWLDEARLLLELTTSRGSSLYVLRMEVGRMDHVASGVMVGFVYR